MLFKTFADIDVFDIELNTHNSDEIIRAVQLLEPTFGGINLEDIKAPECFYIEETLKKTMSIPVFHDDQHGTAIISGAALLNALEIVDKRIEDVRVVFNGAGASGIACALHYLNLGVRPENILLCDTKGVIYEGRTEGMNKYKAIFSRRTERRTLTEALVDADVFTGCSVANTVTGEMIKKMAKNPIIFAMANPDPEITYNDAMAARPDALMATGRSDYPNQVNNVLGFPFIFRGALDVRARTINEEMKVAATHALARLTKEDVPDSVLRAYGVSSIKFGRDYIIPKPFDPRVLLWEATAVAETAMKSGVARKTVDIEQYRYELEQRLGKGRQIMRMMITKARQKRYRIVYPEGENETILRACHLIQEEGFAEPVLIGRPAVILRKIEDLKLIRRFDFEIIDPENYPKYDAYVTALWNQRNRRGLTEMNAAALLRQPNYIGAMMLQTGDVDGMVSGITGHYADTIRPALQVVGVKDGVKHVSGTYIVFTKDRTLFFADTTVNIEPDAETLAEIAIETAKVARWFNVEPQVAMLSFSNFGSSRHPLVERVRKALEIIRQREPGLIIDGEMQADVALDANLRKEVFGFSTLSGEANVLIFPDLQSGNIAYKMMLKLGGAKIIGPILMGIRKPVHVLQYGCDMDDVVNISAIAAVDVKED